ncbi:phage antirepressor KilAC domain-containing protein [Desulfovibrio inopinatus]|uniref:phage antirepressor KilAC domain-containing protein n=1 Tax=Desulfovibrio inopinatus TaxID=102109 RepID=UPI0004076483|nr:phage antirepressor KilAC domain-containing protein [Desulfovibrio inopinatus]
MTDISIFEHPEFKSVRVTMIKGEPWFVAKDIAEALEYKWAGSATLAHVPELWKGVNSVLTPGGKQDLAVLSEQGVYFFLGRSDKPKALSYQMWLAGEVVPSIRKHGAYLTPARIEEVLTDPDTIIRLATNLKAEREQRLALEAQAQALEAERDRLRPKAEAADALLNAGNALPFSSIAKSLHKRFGIGRNRLFRILREKGVLMTNNEPKQVYLERHLFRVIERRFEVKGEMKVGTQTLVTQKGAQFIVGILSNLETQTI